MLTLGQDGHYLEDRDYNIIRYAGAGGSAKCNFCNDKEKNTWFVVKRLGSLYKEDALKESQILQELDHDHVIRCYGAIEDLQDHCFKIFLEHANGTCEFVCLFSVGWYQDGCLKYLNNLSCH